MNILYVGNKVTPSLSDPIFAQFESTNDIVTYHNYAIDVVLDIGDIRQYNLVVFHKITGVPDEFLEMCHDNSTTCFLYTGSDDDFFSIQLVSKIKYATFIVMTQFSPHIALDSLTSKVYFIAQGVNANQLPKFHGIDVYHDVAYMGHLDNQVLPYFETRPFAHLPQLRPELEPFIIRGSKINLNFNRDASGPNELFFKILSSGGFMLTQEFVGMKYLKFRPGVHYDIFRSHEEYVQKIEYYLKNEEERMKIAKKGRDDVFHYNYTTEFLVDEIKQIANDNYVQI